MTGRTHANWSSALHLIAIPLLLVMGSSAMSASSSGDWMSLEAYARSSGTSVIELRPQSGEISHLEIGDSGEVRREVTQSSEFARGASSIAVNEGKILVRAAGRAYVLGELTGDLSFTLYPTPVEIATQLDLLRTPFAEPRRSGCVRNPSTRKMQCPLAGLASPDLQLFSEPRSIALKDGTQVKVSIEHKSRQSAFVRLEHKTVRAEESASLAIPLTTVGTLGSIELIAAHNREFILLVEDVYLDAERRIAVDLIFHWYSRDGSFIGFQVVSANQPVRGALTLEGAGPDVLIQQKKPRTSEKTFVRLKRTSVTPPVDPGAVIRAEIGRRRNLETHSTSLPLALAENSRGMDPRRHEALRSASSYVQMRWIVREENVSTAGRLADDLPIAFRNPRLKGSEVFGAPYHWGGSQKVGEVDRRLRTGQIAGSVSNISYAMKRAGVDCSGLAAAAWGQPHVTTGTLENRARVEDFSSLLPGDFIVRGTDHVVIFREWAAGHSGVRPRVIESSTACSGVCDREIPFRYMVGARLINAAVKQVRP